MKTALLTAALASSLLLATRAHGEVATVPTDCPPGAVGKATGAFGWCEPTVCQNDVQCPGGQVCRAVGLCVQVGSVAADPSAKPSTRDASGDRLVATGRCGPDGECPKDTVCNRKERCVDRAVADRMAPLAAPSAAALPATTPAADGGGKKCGCDVPGSRAMSPSALALGSLALAALVGRRRRPVDRALPR